MGIAQTLRNWWRLQTCSGSICHFAQDSAAARELAATRGVDVSALQSEDLQILKCRKLHKHCQACPRLQAYRQGFAAREGRSRDLHMGGTVVSIKPNVGDGHALPTVTAWLAGITVALLIAASINLDIDDHSAEVAQAADIEHAHQAAAARQRFARAAQAMCGPQSPWSEPAPGVVQCHNKHGRKTVIAQGVTP